MTKQHLRMNQSVGNCLRGKVLLLRTYVVGIVKPLGYGVGATKSFNS